MSELVKPPVIVGGVDITKPVIAPVELKPTVGKPLPPRALPPPQSLAKPQPKPPLTQVVTDRPTLLPPELRGVGYFTGMRGVGKSMLAAQADRPDNVLFWDFEEKGAGIDAQLHFGRYVSMSGEASRRFGMEVKPIDLMTIIREQIGLVEPARYTVAVIDNIEPLETAFYNEVKKHPLNYGIAAGNANSGAFGGAWPGVNYLVSGLVNQLYSKGIRFIIVTAHLKNVWAATGPIPNKFKPKGVERWHELSILSLVLVTGENAPIPSGLVQKEQLASTKFNEETGEIEIVRRVPLRIPKCTFREIRRYLNEPADINKPKSGERPSDEEMSPYNDRFSKDQLNYLSSMAAAQAAGRDEGEEEPK